LTPELTGFPQTGNSKNQKIPNPLGFSKQENLKEKNHKFCWLFPLLLTL